MPHVGLPVETGEDRPQAPRHDLNPMLLSILMMMVQKSLMEKKDKHDAHGNLLVNTGTTPFVSGVGA